MFLLLDKATPYAPVMNAHENVPSTYWVSWIYSTVSGSSELDCVDQCRQDSGCQATVFVNGDTCYLGNTAQTHSLVSSTESKTVYINDGKY